LNTLVYLVYGSKPEYQLELTYSVLSAVCRSASSNSGLRIALVSDQGNRRSDLPIESVVVPALEFSDWTRGGKYHHEAKVHALAKALDLFGGKVALVDTDTYFRVDPARMFERIGPQRSVMHICEGLLGNIPYLKPMLDRLGGASLDYEISRETRAFNSGVVGLDVADRQLLNGVLKLLRQLHELYPVFSVEQFAFSVVLGAGTRLADCQELVRHYYGYERGFNHIQIAQLFPRFTADQFRGLTGNMPQLGGFPKKRPMDLLRARWNSLSRREGPDYRFAYLAYLSARSSAPRSPGNADVWARVAVDALRRNSFLIAHVERDFGSMRDLDKKSWATSQTKQDWASFWLALADDQKRGQLRMTALI
jgi:hypothetical protein